MAGFLMNVGKAGEVAERSPAVISANMKEDMLLQKRLLVLDRSEKSMVHQIQVDQKVLYKRFQSRLMRSRLAYARTMGHKDVEKELRTKTIGALNTDIVGSREEDYGFLAKLDRRPCTASSYSPRLSQTRPRFRPRQQKTTEFPDEKKAHLTKERPASANNEGVGMSGLAPKRRPTMRPATTTGTRIVQEYFTHQKAINKDNKEANIRQDTKDMAKESGHGGPSSQQSDKSEYYRNKLNGKGSIDISDNESDRSEQKDYKDGLDKEAYDVEELKNDQTDEKASKTCENDLEGDVTKQQVKFLEDVSLSLTRPQTVADVNSADSLDTAPVSPTSYSRRASKASDFFVEEKQENLLELRLKEARTKNYDEDVKRFCESLEELKCSRVAPQADYYTIRLRASMDQGLEKDTASVPGTPDDENKRCVGNVFIRSLTITELNWKY